MTLDPSSTLWGTRIREIREACFHLHKVGAQVGNPLQCYRSAEEGTTALRAALAVVEHNRPGFESHRQQPHWLRLTAQAHEAALLQLNALAASLCNSADKLNLGADSRVTRHATTCTRTNTSDIRTNHANDSAPAYMCIYVHTQVKDT